MNELRNVSNAFQTFLTLAPGHSGPWMQAVEALGGACALDRKTKELAYIALLAALRMESGIPFHVEAAQHAGASREEIISAVLLGLPAAGQQVIQSLPAATAACEASSHAQCREQQSWRDV